METFVPSVDIKEYIPVYRDKVRTIVMNLEKFYPGIDEWLDENELDKIDTGADSCWIIVDGKDNVLGVAITGLEKEGIAKLKTFYLSPEIQRYALGVQLLKNVLNHWMEKKIRNLFVTFAEEELDELKGFFDKFGFVMDGMMPQFYRPGKTEYVMSKTFVYDTIDENNFESFVRDFLLRMRGIHPTEEGDDFLAYEDNKLSKTPREIYVKLVKDRNTNSVSLLQHINERMKETKATHGLIISYHPISGVSETEKIKIVDGYSLENIFFPLRLKRGNDSGMILPIRESYAKELMHIEEPQLKIMKKRLMLSHEKAYYTGKEVFGSVGRGGIFLFYQTGGREFGGIIGEAKIKVMDIKTVPKAIEKYVNKGVIKTEEELRKHSNQGKIGIFLLTHVKTYPNKVSLDEIRDIVPEANLTGQQVNDQQLDKIREIAGNNLNSY